MPVPRDGVGGGTPHNSVHFLFACALSFVLFHFVFSWEGMMAYHSNTQWLFLTPCLVISPVGTQGAAYDAGDGTQLMAAAMVTASAEPPVLTLKLGLEYQGWGFRSPERHWVGLCILYWCCAAHFSDPQLSYPCAPDPSVCQ